MIPHDLAFRIDHKIDPMAQSVIIDKALKHGHTSNARPFWVKYNVRSLDRSTIDGPVSTVEDYFYRLDPHTGWFWEDNVVATIVRPLIASIEHLFIHLTRVKVFVQKPDMGIYIHHDLVPGNEYEFIESPHSPLVGTYKGIYLGPSELTVEPNTRHRDQKYLNLKIPLSSRVGDSGKPFILKKDGSKKYLVAHDHLYFLNEYEMFHGCDPVDFHRGIIFVDGILNMEALAAEPKLDFL